MCATSDCCHLCGLRAESATERSDPRTAFTASRRHQPAQPCCCPMANLSLRTSARTLPTSSCHSFSSRYPDLAPSTATATGTIKAAAAHYRRYKCSKTKSYVFLLVFLCAIYLQPSSAYPITASGQRLIYHTPHYRQRYHQQLLQEHRSHAQPTLHRHHLHHRSVASMTDTKTAQLRAAAAAAAAASASASATASGHAHLTSADCRIVAEVLELALQQANTSFNTIKSLLEDYTKVLYQKHDIGQVHTDWQKHKLNLKHELTGLLPATFLEMPKLNHLSAGPMSKQMIVTEMMRINATLQTLEKAFKDVIRDHAEKESQIKHELDIMLLSEQQHHKEFTANELYKELERFFEKLLVNVQFNLNAAKDAMVKLGITQPVYLGIEGLPLDNRREPRDWLLIEEFLCVMQYIRASYAAIRGQCAGSGH